MYSYPIYTQVPHRVSVFISCRFFVHYLLNKNLKNSAKDCIQLVSYIELTIGILKLVYCNIKLLKSLLFIIKYVITNYDIPYIDIS